jgi:predicted transposase/invertase (TIGR01784 family)
MERLRSKARHDEAQALYNAERKKAIEIAKNLLRMNLPIDKIVEATGLTKEEVEGFKSQAN